MTYRLLGANLLLEPMLTSRIPPMNKPQWNPWWRHQIETFSALLAICAGIHRSPQRPVTQSLDVFFDVRLNKRLSKQSWGWWFETLSRPLWRQLNANKIMYAISIQEKILQNGGDVVATITKQQHQQQKHVMLMKQHAMYTSIIHFNEMNQRSAACLWEVANILNGWCTHCWNRVLVNS